MAIGIDAPWPSQLVVVGPALAGVIALLTDRGSPWRWYWGDIARTRLHWWWLAVPVIASLIALASFAAAGAESVPSARSYAALLAGQVLLVALPEEIGWRGYLTRILLARRSPFAASLVVGCVWGLWHGPKLLMLPSLLVVALALSILLTAAYARLSGGTALSALGHGSFNAAIMWLEPALSPERAIFAFNIAAGLLALLSFALVAIDRRWFFASPTQTPR